MEKHILSVLVENKSGVLNRITGLCSRRGYNIASLSVGTTQDPALSRITMVVEGDEYTVSQIAKQLDKLIEVITIKRLSPAASIGRELCFIKVRTGKGATTEIAQIVEIFRANVVDACKTSLTVMVCGKEDKVRALVDMLRPFGILEIAKSGFMAIERGDTILNEQDD